MCKMKRPAYTIENFFVSDYYMHVVSKYYIYYRLINFIKNVLKLKQN
jgi:hypothetical protein